LLLGVCIKKSKQKLKEKNPPMLIFLELVDFYGLV